MRSQKDAAALLAARTALRAVLADVSDLDTYPANRKFAPGADVHPDERAAAGKGAYELATEALEAIRLATLTSAL